MWFGKKKKTEEIFSEAPEEGNLWQRLVRDFHSKELKKRLKDMGLRRVECYSDGTVDIQGFYGDFAVNVQIDPDEIALGINEDEPDCDEIYTYDSIPDGDFYGFLKRRLDFYEKGEALPSSKEPREGLEPMADFFAARAEGYDEHMLSEVEGCKEGYPLMASLLPKSTRSLLDLGCGTGLELDEIFKRFPDLWVTGIDLSRDMMDRLKQKHPQKNLMLICGDYFRVDFNDRFDAAVSFESLHHFTPEAKKKLYRKVCESLKDGGVYIECDYMVDTQEEQERYFAEYDRLKAEQKLPEGYYHYDTPCTVENEIKLLQQAGFASVEQVFRKGGTCMLVAKKG